MPGVEMPEVRYARSGDVGLAYQVVGEGPFDLVYVPGSFSNVELAWTNPRLAAFYGRLASIGRLILFDRRGTGLSDRVADIPPLETRMDDVRAVMDAAESERAAIIGVSEAGPMTLLFAATYPDRAWAAVVYGGFAPRHLVAGVPVRADCGPGGAAPRRGSDDVGDARTRAARDAVAGTKRRRGRERGRVVGAIHASSSSQPGRRSRADAHAHGRSTSSDVLSAIRVPTLIVHRDGRSGLRRPREPVHGGADPRRSATSSCQESTTHRGTATATPSSDAIEQLSDLGVGGRRARAEPDTLPSRLCSSPISSARRRRLQSSATIRAAKSSSSATHRRFVRAQLDRYRGP